MGDGVRVGPGSGPSMTRSSALDAQQRGSGAATLARRTFDVIDVIEILTHWYAGRSQNELATSLGVDRETLRKYTAPAVAAGMAPGGSPLDEQDWRRLATEWFPQLTDHRLRQVSWPGIEPHRDYIAAQLKAGVTVATIHQRLRDEHGLTASVASVRRWVRATLPEQARRARVTVLGDAPPPGEQAQIDYGRLGMWLDPATGRRRAVWAFVMVLAYSRHLFVRPTLVMDQAEWTAAHVEAFAFFGGSRPGWSRTTSRPAWTSRTSTTRRSTAPMLSWPRTTTPWSTRPARPSPKTSRRSSGRCRMSGIRSGAVGSSARWPGCAPTRCAGAARSPGRGHVARWTARPQPRCSPRSRHRRCGRCRSRRSCSRPGRRPGSGPTSTRVSAARSTSSRPPPLGMDETR